MLRLTTTIALVLAQGLLSCAAPGAPRLMRSNSGLPTLADCHNIDPSVRITRLETDFYYTSWGSIWGEIGQQTASDIPRIVAREASQSLPTMPEPIGRVAGIVVARSGDVVATSGDRTNILAGRQLNRLEPQPPGYCRVFQAPLQMVTAAVAEAMASLPHGMERADAETGVFETDFMDGGHDVAIWMDRYRSTVEPLGPNLTGVRVRRQIFISRPTNASPQGEIYNQGVSAGHGEAWVLTRVTDVVAGRPNISTVAVPRQR